MELEVEFQELRRIEDKKKEKWSSKSDQEKGKNGSPGKKPKTGNATSSTDKERAPVATEEGNCGFCGGTNHTENRCWKKLGKCLICGSSQHTIKDCPKNRNKGDPGMQNRQQGTAGRPQVKARAYALAGEEGIDPAQVVEGKVLIQNFIGKALIDPGATYSFILLDCTKRLDLPSESTKIFYEIHTPVKGYFEINVRYLQCPEVTKQS